jgi:hypothetical protein
VIIFDIQICLGLLLFKILENDVNYDDIFNTHAWVYVQWASLISMHVMQAFVKKKKKKNLQCMCSPGIGCLKNFQCPCPPGFTNGFFKKKMPCPPGMTKSQYPANTGLSTF